MGFPFTTYSVLFNKQKTNLYKKCFNLRKPSDTTILDCIQKSSNSITTCSNSNINHKPNVSICHCAEQLLNDLE